MRKHVRETIRLVQSAGVIVEPIDTRHQQPHLDPTADECGDRLACPSTSSDRRSCGKALSRALRSCATPDWAQTNAYEILQDVCSDAIAKLPRFDEPLWERMTEVLEASR